LRAKERTEVCKVVHIFRPMGGALGGRGAFERGEIGAGGRLGCVVKGRAGEKKKEKNSPTRIIESERMRRRTPSCRES